MLAAWLSRDRHGCFPKWKNLRRGLVHLYLKMAHPWVVEMRESCCTRESASTCQGSCEKEARSAKDSRWMLDVGGREREAMRGGEDVGLKRACESPDSHE
jgi:hypothetical protein